MTQQKGAALTRQESAAMTQQEGAALTRLKALIFDCDGVLAETERDGHRVAFNRAFRLNGLDIEWSAAEYGELLRVGGGKERLRTWFGRHPERCPAGWPDESFIQRLHADKTHQFIQITSSGELMPRPGIARLFDEAAAAGLTLCVCSTAHEESVRALIRSGLGEARLARFDAIFAGDAVKAKKPAPDIYRLVTGRFGIPAAACLVIEDSGIGLQAAKAAGMSCVVTVSDYSADDDFSAADLVVSSLGDPGQAPVRILQTFGKTALPEGFPGYITLDFAARLLRPVVQQSGEQSIQ